MDMICGVCRMCGGVWVCAYECVKCACGCVKCACGCVKCARIGIGNTRSGCDDANPLTTSDYENGKKYPGKTLLADQSTVRPLGSLGESKTGAYSPGYVLYTRLRRALCNHTDYVKVESVAMPRRSSLRRKSLRARNPHTRVSSKAVIPNTAGGMSATSHTFSCICRRSPQAFIAFTSFCSEWLVIA